MKIIPFIFPICAMTAGTAAAAGADISDKFGEIAFVGDSITQGAGENLGSADKSRSYRYHLWKIFLTNGVAWNPVGSQTIFRDGSSAGTSQTPNFRGQRYDNRSEGHYGWTGAGFLNGQRGAQANSGAGTLSEWLGNTEFYPNGGADTVALLLGINDLNAAGATYENVAANARKIVKAYQAANPNATVHVFSVLPRTGTASARAGGQAWNERVAGYNAFLEKRVGSWSTKTSAARFHDITAGIDPNGFPDGLHPGNGAGALIVAKNIAKALGLEPVIDSGVPQVKADALASQVNFKNKGGAAWTAIATTAGTPQEMTYFTDSDGGNARWSVGADGILSVATAAGGSGLKLDGWGGGAGTHEFTAEISVKMNASADASKNHLAVWCGNGNGEVGMLYIGEHGIGWGKPGALLCGYVSDDRADGFSMTERFRSVRVAYILNEGSATEGRFCVWLDGELIGDSLPGTKNPAWSGSLLVGDIGRAYEVSAEIASLAFDADAARQPLLTVPKP